MCYNILHPTPSKVRFDVGELCYMHRFGARIISRVDPLPCIFALEANLVVHLPPMRRASLGSVPIFDVESTQEAYVLVHKLFHNVGVCWRPCCCLVTTCHEYSSKCLDGSMSTRLLRVLNVIRKRRCRSHTTTSTSSSTVATTTASASSSLLSVSSCVVSAALIVSQCRVVILHLLALRMVAARVR